MEQNKLVVGIVGKVGSGKSTVSSILNERFGFHHIDVDRFGHTALGHEEKALLAGFGDGILGADGKIDRKKLGDIVFSSPDRLLFLNSVVHPRMKKEIVEFIGQSQENRFVIDGALLFEIGLDEVCDFIITVEAPDRDILKRVEKYRNWDIGKAKKVLASQEYLKFLKEKTDFLIFNNGDIDKLMKQIEFFIHIVL